MHYLPNDARVRRLTHDVTTSVVPCVVNHDICQMMRKLHDIGLLKVDVYSFCVLASIEIWNRRRKWFIQGLRCTSVPMILWNHGSLMTRMRNRQQKLLSLESYCILKSIRNVSIVLIYQIVKSHTTIYSPFDIFLWKKCYKTGPCELHKEKQRRKNRKETKRKTERKEKEKRKKLKYETKRNRKKRNEMKTLRKETKQNRKQRNINK